MATMKAKKKVTAAQYQEARAGYICNENKIAADVAKYNKELEVLNNKYSPGIQALRDAQIVQEVVIQQYCEENRLPMFVEAKSIEVDGLKMGFKQGKAKVELIAGSEDKETEKTLWEKALLQIKKRLPDYIRTVEEISKVKLLEDRELPELVKALPKCGLKIVQEETFFINMVKAKK